jgi:hypothetical protein
MSGGRPNSAGDEDREGIAREPRANLHAHVPEAGLLQQPRQLGVFEAKPAITESLAHPNFLVAPEVEYQ